MLTCIGSKLLVSLRIEGQSRAAMSAIRREVRLLQLNEDLLSFIDILSPNALRNFSWF